MWYDHVGDEKMNSAIEICGHFQRFQTIRRADHVVTLFGYDIAEEGSRTISSSSTTSTVSKLSNFSTGRCDCLGEIEGTVTSGR